MSKQPYSELLALIAVAKERNFTRAAAQLQMSQSMLSHTISKLEERLGVRLLTRTTRSVSVTQAGERLLNVVTPRLSLIETELRSIAQSGDVPVGTLRISAPEHAIDTLLWPRLSPLLASYPQLRIELSTEQGLRTSTQGRADVEVRLAEELNKNSAAIRIGPNLPMAMVAAPAYLAAHAMPCTPEDLAQHQCINHNPGAQPNGWLLGKDKPPVQVQVNARLTVQSVEQVVKAAIGGHGLAYVPLEVAEPHLNSGRLQPVMKPWWRTVPGYHLYPTHPREASRAMQVLIETLRYNG